MVERKSTKEIDMDSVKAEDFYRYQYKMVNELKSKKKSLLSAMRKINKQLDATRDSKNTFMKCLLRGDSEYNYAHEVPVPQCYPNEYIVKLELKDSTDSSASTGALSG